MLNKERLKGKIKAAFVQEQNEEQNANDSLERISEKLAMAIIDEIKELKITYTSGLTAPNGAVSGVLNYTVT
jgi:hypothetical protein